MKLEIKIGKEIIKAKSPKASVWREFEKFDSERANLINECEAKMGEWIYCHAEIIAKVFANEKVTADTIMDNVAVEDIVPLYRDCYAYLVSLISAKLKQIPNA